MGHLLGYARVSTAEQSTDLQVDEFGAGAVGEQLLVEGAGVLNGLLRVLAHDGAAGGPAGDFRMLDRGGEVVQSELVAGGRGGGVVGTEPAASDLPRGAGVGLLSTDLEPLARFADFDGHWLQFSGAIWYPMVYDLPEQAKIALGEQKRRNGMERARRYVEAIGARHVFPHAGPPAFLDEELFDLNDLGQPGNAFPDAPVFLEYLRERGGTEAHLLVPGSTVELTRDGLHLTHPLPPAQRERIYLQKRCYLQDYRDRWSERIAADKATWAVGEEPLLGQLAVWFEPLMAIAPQLCARLGDRVLLDTGRERIVLDFPNRRVVADDGRPSVYVFRVEDTLVRTCVRERYDDWVNSLFLSCRFSARLRPAPPAGRSLGAALWRRPAPDAAELRRPPVPAL